MSLRSKPEEEKLVKTAQILEALISHEDVSESGAGSMGMLESASFHEKKGSALSYALELVKQRATVLGVTVPDFEWPEDKTLVEIIASVEV